MASTASQPVVCAAMNSRSIQPRCDHHVQHAVEDADVAARAHRDEEVGGAGDRRHARIEHDELRAVLARLPEIVGGDRRALGDVRAGDEDHLRLRDVAPRVGAAIDAENLLRRGRRRHHAEPAVVVDVGGAHGDPRELAHQVRLLVGQRGAGQHGEGVAARRRPGCAGSRARCGRARCPSRSAGSRAPSSRASGVSSRSGCSSCM